MVDDLDEMMAAAELAIGAAAQDEADARCEGTDLSWRIDIENCAITYWACCRSCERDFELCYEPEEWTAEYSYCGGSIRCIP